MSKEIDISRQPLGDIDKFHIQESTRFLDTDHYHGLYLHQYYKYECERKFVPRKPLLTHDVESPVVFIHCMAVLLRYIKRDRQEIKKKISSTSLFAWYHRKERVRELCEYQGYSTRLDERFGIEFLENFAITVERHNKAVNALSLFVAANLARYGSWEQIPENVRRVIVEGYERIREGHETITRDATIAANAGSLNEGDAEFLFPPEESVHELAEMKREMMTASRGTQEYGNFIAGFEKRLAAVGQK